MVVLKVCQEMRNKKESWGAVGAGVGGWVNNPNEKDMCRHCETISLCRPCYSHSHINNGQRDQETQLFYPIKSNICQDHKSSYWTVIY